MNSCKPDLNYEIKGYTQKVIVEGSIASGEFAAVYLSLNVPVWEKIDSANVLNHVIRTAKVSVSDGEKTEILTSGWDKTHFPPYVYKGTDLRGVEGKTYTIKVEYSGITLNAVTTIPFGTDIDEFSDTEAINNDSLRSILMSFTIDPKKKTSFKVYTKKKKDGFYTATPLLFNSEFTLSGKQSFNISPRPSTSDPSYSESANFASGDTIQVRFCALDSISTDFFKALTFYSSNSGIGSAFFVGEKNPLKSNISLPGFGIWYGYAVRKYIYVVK